MKLPHLTPVAKGQLWGMAAGFALGLLACARLELSYAIFVIGMLAAWVASERYLAPRLTGADGRTVALAVVSGLAFPAVGVAAAWLLEALRP
ncbi:MAG TPA: hypothetical protein VEA80_10565 [Vitreimonas sp.]|uniref:hypothetical protein n=1 Tax=Vitreimonas sp. TaxID=3069702 RepID=UPI002D3671B7|nr:hypothetical protein [Vitreimonas sp.]HYD87909.1 hypothetical protein [Vitreimonas sp.]